MLLFAHLDGEVGLGVEQLGAEGQQQLLVGVDDVRRLDESLHAHRLRQDRQTHKRINNNTRTPEQLVKVGEYTGVLLHGGNTVVGTQICCVDLGG